MSALSTITEGVAFRRQSAVRIYLKSAPKLCIKIRMSLEINAQDAFARSAPLNEVLSNRSLQL